MQLNYLETSQINGLLRQNNARNCVLGKSESIYIYTVFLWKIRQTYI